MADQKVTDLTADTSPTADDLVYVVNDPSGTPGDRKVTFGNSFKTITGLSADTSPTAGDLVVTIDDPSGTPTPKKVVIEKLGRIIQVVTTETGAVNTGSGTIPTDDTIPQISEGNEFMTLAVTPTSSTNKLKIEVVCVVASSAQRTQTVALFQDAGNDALAAVPGPDSATGVMNPINLNHIMTAGTTSSTTFRVRAGANSAATTTFNGTGGARVYGGVMASSIIITEYIP